jgi:Tripartite tricarboxylate transporter TctB family
MRTRISNKRDLFGGVIIAAFGAVGIFEGYRLGAGTLSKMGPGYVPMSLGFILAALGLVMAANQGDPHQASEIVFDRPEWRGWLCIIAGVGSFIVLGQYAGLVPSAFFSVFISALGDRTATVKGAIILSACTTLFGVVLFHYLLSISIPLFWW